MYENVYDPSIKKDAVGTVAMLRMIDEADVVINETSTGQLLVTKPDNGYHGVVEVANAYQFSVDHPEASVLFIRYAGSFDRYNFVDTPMEVTGDKFTLGTDCGLKIVNAFYTRKSNTYDIDILGVGAPGEIDRDLFGEVAKYAQLTIKDALKVGKNAVTQINPALAEFATDPSIKQTADGWIKRKTYEVEENDNYSLLIPEGRSKIILKVALNGITTTYVLHCEASYRY